jgi:NitT/TauT family transport system substrate-binding protein
MKQTLRIMGSSYPQPTTDERPALSIIPIDLQWDIGSDNFPMMRSLFCALLLAGISAIIAGCNRDNSNAAGALSQLSEVRLGFFPNVTHAQAILGVTSGDFSAAVGPLKFTPRAFNAGPDLIEALNAHQIDVGYVGPGPVINAFAQSHGQGIRVISGSAANGVLIVAAKGSGISQLSDLKGKRIATPQKRNTQDISARHYVTSVLGQADSENVKPIGNAEQVTMMLQGNIDAAWVPEPWGSLLISKSGATLVGEEKDLWPAKQFDLTVLVTTPEFLAAHGDVIQQLLKVHRDWTSKLNTNPADCVAKLEAGIASYTGQPLPPGVVASSLSHVKFTTDLSPATFDTNAQWAFDLGFTKEKTDLTGLIAEQK